MLGLLIEVADVGAEDNKLPPSLADDLRLLVALEALLGDEYCGATANVEKLDRGAGTSI